MHPNSTKFGPGLSAEAKWLTQQVQLTLTFPVLLDEKGKQLTSVQLSTQLEKWRQGTHKRRLVIGSSMDLILLFINKLMRYWDYR
jgi:23S rRNA pseudoU1915 N3-methylase RlmH